MKDRPHDDAMAEVYRNAPELAVAVLAAVEADGDPAGLAIVRRQLVMAASPRPLTPAEIEALRQDMGQAVEWARAELARRRTMKK